MADLPLIVTEAHRTARTNLMFSLSAADKKIVVITSANPREGKSTTCANIGLTLAEMGANVLLVDADLRKPTLHKLFKIININGLSLILGGLIDDKEAINENVAEHLDVITSGMIPPNPAELLASGNMAAFLKNVSERYDYILIDTPPVNLVSDSLVFGDMVSGIIFIVRQGTTKHTDIVNSLRAIEMAQGKVLGFLKVGCAPKDDKAYNNYNYKYAYHKNPEKAPPASV